MVTLAAVGGVAFLLASLAFAIHITKLSLESERHSPKALRSNDTA